MNDDELVKDDNYISLKEKVMENMEGNESTSNSSFDFFSFSSEDEGLNESQQDGWKERPQNNKRSGLVISGLPLKRWNGPP